RNGTGRGGRREARPDPAGGVSGGARPARGALVPGGRQGENDGAGGGLARRAVPLGVPGLGPGRGRHTNPPGGGASAGTPGDRGGRGDGGRGRVGQRAPPSEEAAGGSRTVGGPGAGAGRRPQLEAGGGAGDAGPRRPGTGAGTGGAGDGVAAGAGAVRRRL